MKLFKPASVEPLVLAMTGVRMGDRLLIVGASHPWVIAQLATKPGLTGRTLVVDESADLTAKAADAAQKEGALVDVDATPLARLPLENGSFDVVVINRALGRMAEEERPGCLREVARVIRDGGRCVVIEPGRPGGMSAWFWKPVLTADDVQRLLHSAGFRAVHTLADREGLAFVEGARR